MFKPISLKNQTLISMFTYTDKKYRSVIPFYLQFFFHNKVCICRQVYKFRFLVFFFNVQNRPVQVLIKLPYMQVCVNSTACQNCWTELFFPVYDLFFIICRNVHLKKKPPVMYAQIQRGSGCSDFLDNSHIKLTKSLSSGKQNYPGLEPSPPRKIFLNMRMVSKYV